MKKSSVSPRLPAIPEAGGVADGVAREDAQQADEEGSPAGADGAQGAGEVGDDREGGEAVARRALPSPSMPSVSEIREHKVTHLPYRNWCDECVEAFAREWPHLVADGSSQRSIPVIHMDYACLTEKGLFKKSELSEEEIKHAVMCIVASCSGSKSPFMHVVEAKGTSMDKFAAERIVEDIVFLGHTRYIAE